MARQYAEESKRQNIPFTFFDLEDPTDFARLENPKLTLEPLRGLVVIDEIQRTPELFPLLRVLLDRNDQPARFLILGSASRDLIRQSSESLAGRIEYLELTPFVLSELQVEDFTPHWLRGGFPRSYLATDDGSSLTWRKSYVQNYLERDIPQLGIDIPAERLRRLWMMLAHHHGQILNASELGQSLDLSHNTVKRYIDILCGTFMMRRLPSWQENIKKRQVKAPKIFFRDAGILHFFLGVNDTPTLQGHPKLGASWEGYAMEQLLAAQKVEQEEAYFWSTHGDAELDLLVMRGGKRVGYEFKYSDAPKLTKSMHTAMADLSLDELNVVYPGKADYRLLENVHVRGLSTLLNQEIQR